MKFIKIIEVGPGFELRFFFQHTFSAVLFFIYSWLVCMPTNEGLFSKQIDKPFKKLTLSIHKQVEEKLQSYLSNRYVIGNVRMSSF